MSLLIPISSDSYTNLKQPPYCSLFGTNVDEHNGWLSRVKTPQIRRNFIVSGLTNSLLNANPLDNKKGLGYSILQSSNVEASSMALNIVNELMLIDTPPGGDLYSTINKEKDTNR